MLKLKYLCENFDLARSALTHWDHDPAATEACLPYFRISASAVYPFVREGRRCFLRLIPAEETRAGFLRAELAFLQRLEQRGFPAMQPILARSGETLLQIAHPQGAWYASAFTGVPGQPVEDMPMTDALAASCGEILGWLHREAMAWQAPRECRSHTRAMQWMVRTLENLAAPSAVTDAARDVAARLDALPRTRENHGFIHYDFEPDNIFYDSTGCHVIDFGDSMLHFYAMDVVRALDEMPPAVHPAFLAGYRRLCPDAVHEDSALMRRFRDLYQYARLRHSLSGVPELQPDWMPPLIGRLTDLAAALEARILQP